MAWITQNVGFSQIQMQTLSQHLERLMKQQNYELHDTLDNMEHAHRENHEIRGGDRRRRKEN